MLSEATFDQLVELPGVGPTRAHTFVQLREEAGGEVTGYWLCNINNNNNIYLKSNIQCI